MINPPYGTCGKIMVKYRVLPHVLDISLRGYSYSCTVRTYSLLLPYVSVLNSFSIRYIIPTVIIIIHKDYPNLFAKVPYFRHFIALMYEIMHECVGMVGTLGRSIRGCSGVINILYVWNANHWRGELLPCHFQM